MILKTKVAAFAATAALAAAPAAAPVAVVTATAATATVAVMALSPDVASAHYGHYCGSTSHTYVQDGATWRERLIRDEGTRHTYRIESWYNAPWWDLKGDRWLLNGDIYRTCYNGWV